MCLQKSVQYFLVFSPRRSLTKSRGFFEHRISAGLFRVQWWWAQSKFSSCAFLAPSSPKTWHHSCSCDVCVTSPGCSCKNDGDKLSRNMSLSPLRVWFCDCERANYGSLWVFVFFLLSWFFKDIQVKSISTFFKLWLSLHTFWCQDGVCLILNSSIVNVKMQKINVVILPCTWLLRAFLNASVCLLTSTLQILTGCLLLALHVPWKMI